MRNILFLLLTFLMCTWHFNASSQDLVDVREDADVADSIIEQALPDVFYACPTQCSITGVNTICMGKSTTFIGPNGWPGGYKWTFPNGSTQSGNNLDRITITVGGTYTLELLLCSDPPCSRTLTVDSSSGCVDAPPSCPPDPTGVNTFDAYSGNAHREIKDLEVWGGIGEALVWKRYGNSRTSDFGSNFGNAHNWSNSYRYSMVDNGPQIIIHYPEGGQDIFVQSSATLWLPQAGVDKRLFQSGLDFYLQRSNGYRYHFQKISGIYQLQDFTDTYLNVYKLFYNADKTLDSIAEPAGRYLKISYTTIGGSKVITKVATRDGRAVQYLYDVVIEGSNTWVRLRRVAYGDGTNARYDYSQTAPGEKPNLQKAIDPRYEGAATIMQYTYNTGGIINEERNGITGNVMSTLTTNGDTRTVCYSNGRVQTLNIPKNMFGNVSEYINGAGDKSIYTYDNVGKGFLLAQTDGLGGVTTINLRTDYGNPREITYPDGSKEKWTRDSYDRVLTHTDELGRITGYARDPNGRVLRIDNPDATFETFSYNSFGQVLDHRKRSGAIEHSLYGPSGLQNSFTDVLNNTMTYTYDNASHLASVIDSKGNTEQFEYNERGLLTKEIHADLSFKQYRYDSLGNRDTMINELGNRWITRYDPFRRADSLIDPLGRITIYNYSLPGGVCGCSHDNDKLTRITYPTGKITEIGYDLEWRKIRETKGLGSPDEASTFYEYDVLGNVISVIDPKGTRWVTAYDLRNRKSIITDPLGNKTQWTYDLLGNVLSIIRPDNGTTNNQYDNMNRLTQSTDPKLQVTKWMYDAEGNMIKLSDPRGNDYSFQYDLLNRRQKMIYPDGSFEAYSYDAVGNLASYTNRTGDIRSYTYDNRNRETNSSWNVNTPATARSYDVASNLLTKINNVSSLTYNYNIANELMSETQHVVGNSSKIVSYTYSADGLRNSTTYPGGNVISYNYTTRNQVKSISIDGAPPLASYTYDYNGKRISKALNNGTNVQYYYDDDSRILGVDNKKVAISFARFDYQYNNVGVKKFVKRDNGKGDVYTYDAIDQVVDVKYDALNPDGIPSIPVRSVSYELDAVGNRTSFTDNSAVTSYMVNNLNEYTSVGGVSATYTVNGNLQTFDVWTYTYDAQDRLIKAEKTGVVVLFAYDAGNRCVKRTVNGTATFLYYDNWNLIEERTSSDIQIGSYVHGAKIDEILIKIMQSNVLYYHHDGLGNVVSLTDKSGLVLEKYSYDVFGIPSIKNFADANINASAFDNRFMFTGREFIKEIGLYDYRNRIYSPLTGRFLQVDPLSFSAADVNLYRYTANNPTNYVDFSGLVDDKTAGKSCKVGDKRCTVLATEQRFLPPGEPETRYSENISQVSFYYWMKIKYEVCKSCWLGICDPYWVEEKTEWKNFPRLIKEDPHFVLSDEFLEEAKRWAEGCPK